MQNNIRLMTLDPGHFHAALVQKRMYEQVSPVVSVFAPEGPDLDLHLQRVEAFNQRADQPTNWQHQVHAGPDYLDAMLQQRPGTWSSWRATAAGGQGICRSPFRLA